MSQRAMLIRRLCGEYARWNIRAKQFQLERQKDLLEFRGRFNWVGDLDAMRTE